MNRKLLYLILFSILFTACDSKSQKAQEVQSVDVKYQKEIKKTDTYTLTTTKGEKISLELDNGLLSSKQLNGKMVLLNFWAPWCKPCIKEMPSFVKLQEQYKDDFIIVGVLFDKKTSKEELSTFMKKHNVNFPVTVGEENYKLAKAFDDVQMIPESFLYTKGGLFVKKFVGEISHSVLETYIKEQ